MAGQPGGSGGGGEASNSPGDPGGEGVSPGNLNGGTWYGNDGGSGGPRARGGGGGGAGGAGVPNPTMSTSNSGGEGERFQPFAYSLAFLMDSFICLASVGVDSGNRFIFIN